MLKSIICYSVVQVALTIIKYIPQVRDLSIYAFFSNNYKNTKLLLHKLT